MLNRRVLGVAHLSSQLRSTQPTPLRMRFQFPNLHRQLNVSELCIALDIKIWYTLSIIGFRYKGKTGCRSRAANGKIDVYMG